LAARQAVGLLHADLPACNVLIGADGHATVIDYSAIRMAGHGKLAG
jgi:RIO-like serine/threonine protein kinase